MLRLGGSVVLPYSNKEEWLGFVKDLNYSTIIYPFSNNTISDAEAAEFKKLLKDNNLTLGEVGVWNNPMNPDKSKKTKAVDICKQRLKIADMLNANCCVNISGAKGPIWDGLYKDNYSKGSYEELVETIQDIIDDVKPSSTFYTIECMPWMVPDSPQQYLKLIEDVNRSAFGVHLDYVNMINCPRRYAHRDEFIEECFDLLGEHIKSVHIKDIRLLKGFPINLEECSPGEGDINLEQVLYLCSMLKTEVTLFVEHMNTYEEYKNAVSYLRELAEKRNVVIL